MPTGKPARNRNIDGRFPLPSRGIHSSKNTGHAGSVFSVRKNVRATSD